MLQAKCLSELLRSTLSGNNQMGYIFTYITLFLWLALTVFWCALHTHPHSLSSSMHPPHAVHLNDEWLFQCLLRLTHRAWHHRCLCLCAAG